MKFRLLLLALLASVLSLSAQDIREVIKNNPNYSASNLLSYYPKQTEHTVAPKGYKPFYISHYGRHGGRWHTNSRYYEAVISHFVEAEKHNALTELGKDVYGRLKAICKHATGHEGQLTSKGVKEHRGIAERMVGNYPEIFSTKGGRECRIECISTLYPRCILSMAANNERIKELCPKVQFTRTTGSRYLSFMSKIPSVTKIRQYYENNLQADMLQKFMKADRLALSLFTPEYAAGINKCKVMKDIYYIAGIMQNFEDIDVSLYDLFTEEELFNAWLYNNSRHYTIIGPSTEYCDIVASDAVPLMRHIIADVDDVIANGGRSGFLRFGHDMTLVPLINLLDLKGRCARVSILDVEHIHEHWQDVNITSMAANVQLIFYRNRAGEVLVKVLHNEVEAELPIDSEMAPYYRWEDFRSYYLDKAARLDKLELPTELKSLTKVQKIL